MSDESEPETTPIPIVRSRRAVIAGALGGVAGLLAGRLGKPDPASAAAGSALILGSEANNAGTANTQVIANSNVVTFKLLQNGPGTGLMGYATPTTGTTRGVYGRVDSPNGDGIQARNAGAAGSGGAIRAYGGANSALIATTEVANGVVIAATNTSGATGVNAGAAIRGLTGGATVADVTPASLNAVAAAQFGGEIGVIGVTSTNTSGVVGLGGVSGQGVAGSSESGIGVRGESFTGYGVIAVASTGVGIYASSAGHAGVFIGSTSTFGFAEMAEIADPAAADTNTARLFVRDNGVGKTQLCVRFPTGAIQVLSTEP